MVAAEKGWRLVLSDGERCVRCSRNTFNICWHIASSVSLVQNVSPRPPAAALRWTEEVIILDPRGCAESTFHTSSTLAGCTRLSIALPALCPAAPAAFSLLQGSSGKNLISADEAVPVDRLPHEGVGLAALSPPLALVTQIVARAAARKTANWRLQSQGFR